MHRVTTKKANRDAHNRASTISNKIYELQADFSYEFQERSHVRLCVERQVQSHCATKGQSGRS